ncbi:MAG TPA: acyl-ACP desaturase [Bacteroidota bacterium]|nr:acyl-ACP desaturase [Bacteroidota bacterium]
MDATDKRRASRMEIIESIDSFVGSQVDSLLASAGESWQPSDFLPDLARTDWAEQVAELRLRAAALPDALLVVLVGDMVTEEALPTYQTWINRLSGVTDTTGASETGWARWSRGWTAEENRHGDLLNKYLYLSGRVDMKAVEITIHNLIGRGFDPQTENDPYLGFIYTAFQERATKVSHRNVATLAMRAGEERLQRICGMIAGDEARHEKAYKLFMNRIFEIDPHEAVRAFGTMMKRKIVMPAVLMRDAVEDNLYAKFSRIAQSLGVYTAHDYADIIDDLVHHWKISTLAGLSGHAAEAQDFLCGLAARYRALAERAVASDPIPFSWIFGKAVL